MYISSAPPVVNTLCTTYFQEKKNSEAKEETDQRQAQFLKYRWWITWLKISPRTASQSTLYLQIRQDAVAKEPIITNTHTRFIKGMFLFLKTYHNGSKHEDSTRKSQGWIIKILIYINKYRQSNPQLPRYWYSALPKAILFFFSVLCELYPQHGAQTQNPILRVTHSTNWASQAPQNKPTPPEQNSAELEGYNCVTLA